MTRRVQVPLSDELVDQLEAHAADLGVPRTVVIAEAIGAWLDRAAGRANPSAIGADMLAQARVATRESVSGTRNRRVTDA